MIIGVHISFWACLGGRVSQLEEAIGLVSRDSRAHDRGTGFSWDLLLVSHHALVKDNPHLCLLSTVRCLGVPTRLGPFEQRVNE